MQKHGLALLEICLLAASLMTMPLDAAGPLPIVIAHRGASGYLPEHTLAAKAMAHAQGADFVEQDVVLTKDDVPIVLHDVHLDTVTNVAKVFPTRARKDGRYYAIDFTLAEIRRLQVSERIDLRTGKVVFPNRFPAGKSRFALPTLAEEIELVQGLNRSTARDVGIYPEIKAPAWHRQQGKDISKVVLGVLDRYGYRNHEDNIFVQCFDAAETRRLREQLKSKLKLIQLIGENRWREAPTDYDKLRTPAGIREVAEYADGIGPSIDQIVRGKKADGSLDRTDLVQLAHDNGLAVHPYTFRVDALPAYAAEFEDLLTIFCDDVGIDGLFTDFPDRAVSFIHRRPR